MNEIFNLIREFNNDPNVIELNNYYKSISSMEMLRATRDEKAHSSFLACLFSPDINYGLGTTPLMLLLDLLIQEDHDGNFPNENKQDIIIRKSKIISEHAITEYPYKKECRIDIYIPFSIDNNQYAIVLENKVRAKENIEKKDNEKDPVTQTEKYYSNISKSKLNVKYIYVFLAPQCYNEHNGDEKVKAKDKHFINISYSDIVNYVITPILKDNTISEQARYILEDYLKALSKPNIVDLKKDNVKLATSEYEENLINVIKDKHAKLDKKLNSTNTPEESSILEQFSSESNNEFVVSAIWGSSRRKRKRNRTFDELGIEPGTILTLSSTAGGNKPTSFKVKTINNINKVEYVKNDKIIISSISPAAEHLTGKKPLNGFEWFIDDKKGNLVNIPRDDNF